MQPVHVGLFVEEMRQGASQAAAFHAFGTAAGVIERLRCLRDELGLDGIVAELNPGGLIPPELETRSLELLAREVVPSL